MEKKPFLTEAMAQEIIQDVPTPFHVYDEKGIRENARRINKAFSWNKGFKEYFAVKALPNPVILQILQEEGCGVDCSSLTELMLSEVCGFTGSDIMFSSNQTPVEDMQKAYELGAYVTGASAKNLKVTGGAGADEGYVYFFDTPLGWQEHYYLYPLPLKQLALNTNLEQNPVWTK